MDHSPFDALYGFELVSLESARATARIAVRDEVRQPAGIVHGGVFASLAEGLATAGTMEAIDGESFAVGQSNYTSFLRPVSEGFVHAHAVAKHRGRTSWVWEVELTDDQRRLAALTRMTVAVRPRSDR